MEVYPMDKMSMIYEALLELHAEKILNEAIRKYHAERLYQEIDHALKKGDQVSFLALTNELNMLNKVEKPSKV